ncbi:hypothetical protein HDV63DRAFT_365994 [Trichoderma sp. SZMC 28014]
MSLNHGKYAEPLHSSRLSSQTRKSAVPRASYLSSRRHTGTDWEDWEDDDVVTLIDIGETPAGEHSDHQKLFTNSPFLNMNAGSSAMNTRSPSPLESDSLSVSSNEEVSPIEDDVQTGLQAPPPTPALFLTKVAKHPSVKVSMRRSTARISRPVSKRPPKQRNAKLGITLITDMTKLRRQNHLANQAKSPARRNAKFADAAALRALEGSPNPQSVGNWNWLRRGNNGDREAASPSPLRADEAQSPEQLSPEARPIVIGITLPSDEVESRGIDPLTATVNNIDTPNGDMRNPYPFNFQTTNDRAIPPSIPTQLKSMWSPDTPDTASSFSTIRYPSSVYSQASMAAIIAPGLRDDEVPPVPALPAGYKQTTSAIPQRLMGTEQRKNKDDEDDSGTPCTLFEEDGVTPLKSPASKLSARTPDSVRGWWDHHLVTPFLDMRMSFASRRTQMESPLVAKGTDNKGEQNSALTPKSPWRAVISKPDTKQISPSVEKNERQNPTTVDVEGDRAILGLSMLERQRGLSTFSPDSAMSRDVDENKSKNAFQGVSKVDDDSIMITIETEENKTQSDKSRAVNESSTLTSRSDKHQNSSSKFHEMISSETSKSKQEHTYEFVSTEIRERHIMPTDSQPKHEQKRDLTPPPRPLRQEVQAPIIRAPTPRQTPPPREVGMREGSERPIVVHIQINTGEQPQKYVVDRVGLNSTPTIKIPTPRRTPSPRRDALRVDVAAEAARGAFGHHEAGTREMVQGLGITHLRADTPPSPSSKKQAEAAIKYQAVFPPGHHLHTQGPQAEASRSVASATAPVASAMTTVPAAYAAHTAHAAAPITASTTADPTASVAAERAAPVTSRAASHEADGAAAASVGAGILSSRGLRRLEQVERSREEVGSITHEASTKNRSGGASLSTRNVEDTSANVSRSVGAQLPAHVRETQASTTHPTSEHHSRFSVSPTSSESPDAERKARVGSGHVRAASNFVTSVLNRQRSPVDHRRGETRAIQPVEIVLEERRAPGALPAAPERAYLTINEIPSGNKSWIRVDSPSLEHGFTEHSAEESHGERKLGKEDKIERKRLRHEKEEKIVKRAGGLWRGRGCVPKKGCFGRPGPEGRKKRRIWCCIIGFLLLLIIILAIVLGVVLSRHHGSGGQSSSPAPGQAQSPSSPSTPSKPSPLPSSTWVNLTDYPAMPTGVLTFVGPNNTIAKNDCTQISTSWSCALPKDSQASVSPFKPNQPTIIFQIQWDNSTDRAWNIPNGTPPTPISKRGESNGNSSIDGFIPDPSPPSFDEMFFLGETTDNIQSSQKAGEPTPFFISILESLNDTAKSPSLSRRTTTPPPSFNLSDFISPPDLKADGTPAPAVMLPTPVQQPVRLFDRGLPTEHYGFYTYFERTIFLSSLSTVPADENGGCSETEASHLVTWAQTRMLVQIWTRKLNSTGSLLPSDGQGIDDSPQLIQPGTMPYPVTVTLDTHGGDPDHKVVWEWPMDDHQKLNLSAPVALGNNIGAGGTWINPRTDGNATFGGFDGGTGGCKCQWANWS